MHMAHNFSLQDASLPRAKRAELAAKEMGQPIFLGVTTTFLAILPLAFSSSQAFRVFFQMLGFRPRDLGGCSWKGKKLLLWM